MDLQCVEVPVTTLDALLIKAERTFREIYKSDPDVVVAAPGRVNLIGDHTDYNGGYFLPMAISLYTVVVGRKVEGKECNVFSLNVDDKVSFETPLPMPEKMHWSNYVKGVVAYFFQETEGFNAVITSSVPLGCGLASSASLTVAFYTFLEAVNITVPVDLMEKVLACVKAEREFAFNPCGIMDHIVISLSQEKTAMLVNCKVGEFQLVFLNDPSVTFMMVNCNIKQSMGIQSNFDDISRISSCADAMRILGKTYLADVTIEEADAAKNELGESLWEMVKYIITESKRALDGASALKVKDYVTFGKLMTESQKSLRCDFNIAPPEVGQLVNLISTLPGVYGSKITGGGPGGWTISLVRTKWIKHFINTVKKRYPNSAIYACVPSEGARTFHGSNTEILRYTKILS